MYKERDFLRNPQLWEAEAFKGEAHVAPSPTGGWVSIQDYNRLYGLYQESLEELGRCVMFETGGHRS